MQRERWHVVRTLAGLTSASLVLMSCKPLDAPSNSPASVATDKPITQLVQAPTEPISTQVVPTEAAVTMATTAAEDIGWPEYVLVGVLPDSPTEVRVYSQVVPEHLPETGQLAGLWDQLQVTGTLSSRAGEAGDRVVTMEGDSGSAMVWSADPLMVTLQTGADLPTGQAPTPSLPVDERAKIAEGFLEARGLLDFPYRVEAPYLSRNRDSAVRIVPLIDGIPLADYDSLNGRLLVEFNAKDEVSVVYWRPLKLEPGEMTAVIPAATAWEQLKAGSAPSGSQVGQCWQTSVLDPDEPYGVASPLNQNACVNYMSGPIERYSGATISKVELVYFASDLSLGMSPFALPADSTGRIVYPLWRFTGMTNDGRLVEVLWPAMAR